MLKYKGIYVNYMTNNLYNRLVECINDFSPSLLAAITNKDTFFTNQTEIFTKKQQF